MKLVYGCVNRNNAPSEMYAFLDVSSSGKHGEGWYGSIYWNTKASCGDGGCRMLVPIDRDRSVYITNDTLRIIAISNRVHNFSYGSESVYVVCKDKLYRYDETGSVFITDDVSQSHRLAHDEASLMTALPDVTPYVLIDTRSGRRAWQTTPVFGMDMLAGSTNVWYLEADSHEWSGVYDTRAGPLPVQKVSTEVIKSSMSFYESVNALGYYSKYTGEYGIVDVRNWSTYICGTSPTRYSCLHPVIDQPDYTPKIHLIPK